MYWRASNAAAWRGLWDAVRDAAPQLLLPELTPPEALPPDWGAHWVAQDLALSQTCGLPFRTQLKGRVHYVATFDFGLEAPPGWYVSHAVGRRAPRRPPRLAFNAPDSQSGWAAASDGGPFAAVFQTGSHEASARMVADGRADLAYLDAVTWRLLQTETDLGAKLRVLRTTAPTPGLPLITSSPGLVAPLRDALGAAVARLNGPQAAALGGLQGVRVLNPDDYYAVPAPPAPEELLVP